ncbi:MAG: T9SS type A sorting domain-containing protein [Ignavibacteria bacterium]
MKKIILLFILTISSQFDINYAQVDACNYYPLKAGNVWVYQFSSSFGSSYKLKKSLSSTVISNGHKYYYIDNNYIRIDSNNANVYQQSTGNGCPWSLNEKMTDSLATRLNDTAKRNCGADINRCIDTNIRIKFGISMRTKHIIYQNAGNSGNLYARGFGIISGYGGSGQNLWGIELLGCVIDGVVYGDTSMLVGINQISTEIPKKFQLQQNYPNPFNPVTKIKFNISRTSSALTFLSVYDILGHEVAVLVNEQLRPGSYEADWNASAYPSGVYYYKFESGSFSETKKMVLIK